jgi:hypothetical protein
MKWRKTKLIWDSFIQLINIEKHLMKLIYKKILFGKVLQKYKMMLLMLIHHLLKKNLNH